MVIGNSNFNNVICVILCAKRLSGVLRQCILMTYSPLIFGCANYASFSLQSTFFNSVRITYFCMRMTPSKVFQRSIHGLSLYDFCLRPSNRKMTKWGPQATYFNDVITAYLCMIFVCIKLSQNLIYIYIYIYYFVDMRSSLATCERKSTISGFFSQPVAHLKSRRTNQERLDQLLISSKVSKTVYTDLFKLDSHIQFLNL